MNIKEGLMLLGRYLLLIVLAISNLYLFYLIFTPLTIYPVYWILHAIYNAKLLIGTNTIFFKGYYAELISACIAGAAYYLLLILNLSTPMHIKKRIKSLVFIFLAFLILNIARIVIFASLLEKGFQYFDLTHQLTWYFGSTILVVLVWFSNIFLFKIKAIPIYTDIMMLFKDITSSKADREKERKRELRRKIRNIELRLTQKTPQKTQKKKI